MNIETARAFQFSQGIIELSIANIQDWEQDTELLEEILIINHRGWEFMFKTFRYTMSKGFDEGHCLKKQINLISKEKLFTIKRQNLDSLFFSDKYQNYFKALDELFADTKNRYRVLNNLMGKKNGENFIIDKWIKKYTNWFNESEKCINYTTIRDEILTINRVCMRFIALHFSMSNDANLKQISACFNNQYYSFYIDEFS